MAELKVSRNHSAEGQTQRVRTASGSEMSETVRADSGSSPDRLTKILMASLGEGYVIPYSTIDDPVV
jgi:hypothetical protein